MDKLITYFQIVFPTTQRIKSLVTKPNIIIECINIYKDSTAIEILEKHPECASYIDYSTNITPLIASCKYKYSNLALKLINADKTNINHKDREDNNAVKYVIKNQMWGVFDELLKHDVILDYFDIYTLCETLDEKRLQSILLKPSIQDLTKNNIVSLLKVCIGRDIAIEHFINENTVQDGSLLTHAITSYSLVNFKLLLKHGAKLDHIDSDGDTYLTWACRKYIHHVKNIEQTVQPSNIEIILRILLDSEFVSKYDVTKVNNNKNSALDILTIHSYCHHDGYQHGRDYDKKISVHDLILPLFKIVCKQNKTKQIYRALGYAIVSENHSLCFQFISAYNFDPTCKTYKNEVDFYADIDYDRQRFGKKIKNTIIRAQRHQNVENIINEIIMPK